MNIWLIYKVIIIVVYFICCIGGVEDFNELSNRPLEITTNQVDSGVGTDPVLITPTKAKAMIEKHSTGHIPVMVSATDFTTVALALANAYL
jgi:hypothetical protein